MTVGACGTCARREARSDRRVWPPPGSCGREAVGSSGFPSVRGAPMSSGEFGPAPVLTLIGQRVALGPWHRGMLPLIAKWENDLPLSVLTGDPVVPQSPEGIETIYNRFAKTTANHVSFVIYERATLRPIG